jgi:hypothetical protein
MEYPVLYLPSTSSDIWPMTDDRILRRCFDEDIPGFVNSMIIDRTGRRYVIKEAIRQGWATFLWGYHPMYRKRLVSIRLVFGTNESISLSDAKALLIRHVFSGKTTKWATRIFGSRARLQKLIDGAGSWEDIFKVLLFDTH